MVIIMAWQDYSILGGDITKDVQYEICKLVGGAAIASDMVLHNQCRFGTTEQNTFLDNLPTIYRLCKSDNKIEETWNMQVLGLFVLENQTQTQSYIKRDSARVVWEHIKYELDNLSSFGWNTTAANRRRETVDNLYQQFGRIPFHGLSFPFGLPMGETPVAQPASTLPTGFIMSPPVISVTRPPSPVPVPMPITMVAPPDRPTNNLEIINVGTGRVLPGQHTVLNTVREWTKYTYHSKQWSYRVLGTNRGYIVQTRWGKTWRATFNLRVTTKAFNSERLALAYVTRTVNTKQNNGYVLRGA